MAEKSEALERFIDMVDGPAEEIAEPVEQVEEEVVETEEELPSGDDHEVEPVVEGDDAEGLIEVTVGDKVYEVPEDLKAQLDIAQDYTVKTQELSAERKTLQAVQEQNKLLASQFEFYQSVQEEAQQLQAINASIEQYRQYKRQNIDTLTPTDFMKIDNALEELQEQYRTIENGVVTKQTEFQQAQEQARKALLDKSTEALRSKIPNWGDETDKQTREFGRSLGFTEDEVNAVADPRYMEVLWMASQYKALKDKTVPAVGKLKTAPAIQPKARRSMPKETQEALNLRKQLKSTKLSPREKRRLAQEDIGKRWA